MRVRLKKHDCRFLVYLNTVGIIQCFSLITTGNVIDDNRQTDRQIDRLIEDKALFSIAERSIDRFIHSLKRRCVLICQSYVYNLLITRKTSFFRSCAKMSHD